MIRKPAVMQMRAPQNPIWVGIDTTVFEGPMTGVANYCLHLMKANMERPNLSFVGFSTRNCQDFSKPELARIEALNEKKCSELPTFHPGRAWLRRCSFKVRSQLGRISAVRSIARGVRKVQFGRQSRVALDLFHAFRYVPFADVKAPVLPIVYDLSFVRYPDTHPKARLRELSRLSLVIERAPLIHTISEFSKREIIDHYGCSPEKIIVAPPAAADDFVPAGKDISATDLSRLGLKWRGYLLAVGTLEPRKNLRTIIDAYARLPSAMARHCPMVIVGNKGWGSLDLPQQTSRLIREGSLRFLEGVPDWQLRSLYEGALALLYPSIYEGFGMPVVEAFACGTAVVHSQDTSMDEVTDGLARRIVSTDTESWKDALAELIDRASEDDDVQQRVARINQAQKFSWERSAAVVREAYEVLAAR